MRTVKGRIGAHVEATTPAGPRTADAGAGYSDEFKGEVRIPEQASSEDSLEHLPGRAGGTARRRPPSASLPIPWKRRWPWTATSKDGNRLGPGRPLEGGAGQLRGPQAVQGATRKRRACTTSEWPTRPWPHALPHRQPGAPRRCLVAGPGFLQEGARPRSRREVLHGAHAEDRGEPAIRGQRASATRTRRASTARRTTSAAVRAPRAGSEARRAGRRCSCLRRP